MLVPPEVRKCVTFLCFNGPKGIRLAGTAFFVNVEEDSLNFIYLVTARHVIDKISKNAVDKKALIRINRKEGNASFVEANLDGNWFEHPSDSSVDACVLPWAPPKEFDVLTLPAGMAATDEIVEKEGVGPGDEVFLTGLFVNHFGKQHNIPIIRIGNIAAMPEERVESKLGPIDAYLIEARSIGGLSGSPVFVHLTGVRQGSLSLGREPIFWLGLMHGHWDTVVAQSDMLGLDQFEGEKVNMGIGIVVPVTKILEILNQPDLAESRRQQVEKQRDSTKPLSEADT